MRMCQCAARGQETTGPEAGREEKCFRRVDPRGGKDEERHAGSEGKQEVDRRARQGWGRMEATRPSRPAGLECAVHALGRVEKVLNARWS